jgi:hypothetical protein
LVYLDRIFILAEPATQVEGCSEDAVQEAKRSRVREMEMKLLESQQQLKSELVFSPFSFSLMCLCTDDNGSPSWPDSQSGYLCFD